MNTQYHHMTHLFFVMTLVFSPVILPMEQTTLIQLMKRDLELIKIDIELLKLRSSPIYSKKTLMQMSQLLRGGVNPNEESQQDELGNTPLHHAIDVQCFDAVQMLLHFGANPTIPNSFGETAEDFAYQGLAAIRNKAVTNFTSKVYRRSPSPPCEPARTICDLIQDYKCGKKLPKGKQPSQNYDIVSSVVAALNRPDATGKTPLWQLVERMATKDV